MSDVFNKSRDKYLLLIGGYVREFSTKALVDIPEEICGVIHHFYPKTEMGYTSN